MSVLRDFERRLEGLVEGLFSKTFRSGLQPVELAKRVLREMDAGRTVGADGTVWVPNRFVFTLGPEDSERFASAHGPLTAELAQVVRDGAAERGWGLMGDPQIEFATDDTVSKGDFRCDASLAEGSAPLLPADAELNVMEGDRRTQSFPITGPVTTIGRLGDCDLTLADPAASRRHAEIRKRGDGYVIADLQSTNGTLLNGTPIAESPIEDGDRITIGQTTLEFRRVP